MQALLERPYLKFRVSSPKRFLKNTMMQVTDPVHAMLSIKY
jgi:hypothetical protein